MEQSSFQRLRDIAYQHAGIDLPKGKEALVSARVAKRMRALGIPTEMGYADYLAADRSGEEMVEFLNAISTNFTSFFREEEHFEILRHFVGDRLAAGQRKFRFWSAASSTGEEPYTIAMSLADLLGRAGANWSILATDISTKVLQAAVEASYPPQTVEKVPRPLLSQYFTRAHNEEGEEVYQVVPQLRERIGFRRLNLSTPPYPMRGPIDVIFCRNVMIYFDKIVRQRLIDEFERLLPPGGLLLVSHSETLTGLKTRLTCVQPSVYLKPGAAP